VIDILAIISCYQYANFAAYRGSAAENKELVWFYEFMFFFDMLLQFCVDVPGRSEDEGNITDFYEIAKSYIHGDFIFNLIPIIPL
jgi:hypothetical protein